MNYNQGYYMDDYSDSSSYVNYSQNRGCNNGYNSQEKFLKHDDNDQCMCCIRTVCYYPVSWDEDCNKNDNKKPCDNTCGKEDKRPCHCNQDLSDEKYDCKNKSDECDYNKKLDNCDCKKEDTKKPCNNNSRCCRNNRCCGWFCRGWRF